MTLQQLIAGGLAGAASTTVTHPLDLFKVYLQVSQQKSSLRQEFSLLSHFPVAVASPASLSIHKYNVLHLYKGYGANLTANSLSWAVYFYAYSKCKSVILPQLSGFCQDGNRSNISGYFACSVIAGLAGCLLITPFWVARTKIFLSSHSNPPSIRHSLENTYKTEGFRGLYRGFVPATIATLHSGIQFSVYELMKELFGTNPSTTQLIISAGTSKLLASSLAYPVQVMKSRLQMGGQFNLPIMRLVINTFREEGVFGFFKGIVPNTLRILPGSIITFVVYESILKCLNG